MRVFTILNALFVTVFISVGMKNIAGAQTSPSGGKVVASKVLSVKPSSRGADPSLQAGESTAMSVDLTLSVNLSRFEALGDFIPDTNVLVVRGNFEQYANSSYGNWAGNEFPLSTANAGDSVFNTTLQLSGISVGDTLQYKFVIIDTSHGQTSLSDETDGGGTWEENVGPNWDSGNRVYELGSSASQVIPTVFFDNDSAATATHLITFEADMSDLLSEGFDPSKDTISVMGSWPPLSWSIGTIMSRDLSNTNVFEATVRLPMFAGSTLEYKYRATPASLFANSGWDTLSNNRTLVFPYQDTTLLPVKPEIYFSAYPLSTAPDTVLIPAGIEGGGISSFIMGDTTSTGARAHPNRVYMLHRDSIYFFSSTIDVDSPINIIASPGSGTPPIIAPLILVDNSSPDMLFEVSGGSLKLNNIYLLGVRADETYLGYGTAIHISGNNVRLTVDSCVFDGWTNEAIGYSGNDDSFYISDCIFRNLIHPTGWYLGRVFQNDNYQNKADTVIMVNNTMFCLNAYAFCPITPTSYTLFDHNTVFLTTVNPLYDFFATNAIYRNNIFYGTLAAAQTNTEISQGWDDYPPEGSSTFSFDTLSASTFANGYMPESQRKVEVLNNDCYWPQSLVNFWNTSLMDTLTPPVFMNARTRAMFNNKTEWPGFAQSGNDSVDPEFNFSVTNQIDSLIQFVRLMRTNQLGAGGYLWDFVPNREPFQVQWPLPENLAYTNSALMHAGTDGFALGDLNWFPAQKAAWKLSDTPLPVQATAFDAVVSNGSVVLTWRTQSELDNLGFVIDRKDVGTGISTVVASYKSDASLTGLKSSTTGREYSYTDKQVVGGQTYLYTVKSVSTGGTVHDYPAITVRVDVPSSYALYQNYPNPFNPTTTIAFDLKEASNVTLSIYNVLGQRVAEWSYGNMSAGSYKKNIEMDRSASGVYYYRINAAGNNGERFVSVKRMMLLK